MNRNQKLEIARYAYKEIKKAIDVFEAENDIFICAHWDECITVDDELFQGAELRNLGKNENKK